MDFVQNNRYKAYCEWCSDWHYTKEVSDVVTKIAFKSFPKSSLNLEWVRWRETGFSFNFESYLDACQWHEDGY